ncbi:MAG TPA: LytTR family DNA-binding domain-containing protein [Gemmatimonadales bacterium]|nr:LytTR family DNA-binding domain-containing protein [Gemmatimonadales bacterium]
MKPSAPLRVVVVDDEPLVRVGLRRTLAAIPGVELVADCRHGLEAIKVIRSQRPDLVLLDIQMPGLTGFDVVTALDQAERPAIVFVTAFDEHAVRAFEVQAVDYLLKPFDDERVARAIERARQRLEADRVLAGTTGLAGLVGVLNDRSPWLERLLVRERGRTEVVAIDEVEWFEAADNYVRLHLGARREVVRETLSGLERRLDPARFCRVHRSIIVNLSRVRRLAVAQSGDGEATLQSGASIPVSRGSRKSLEEALAGRSG